MDSSACKEEMNFALNPDNNKIAIPIILKPRTWLQTSLKDIQSVPKDGKPIAEWESEDSAWLNVENKIAEIINSLSNKPKQKFLDEIDKTEFRNSGIDDIQLSDIFVNPEFDFSTIDGRNEKKEFIVKEFISDKNRFCLISGEDLSGKTSFLYRLFNKETVDKGLHPVFIDGDNVKKTRNFAECIQKALAEQYENVYWNSFYKNIAKILLIDNYAHTISDNFIYWAKENFKYIYIAINSDELLLFFKDSKLKEFLDVSTEYNKN